MASKGVRANPGIWLLRFLPVITVRREIFTRKCFLLFMLVCHAAASEPGSGSKAVAEKIHIPRRSGSGRTHGRSDRSQMGGPRGPVGARGEGLGLDGARRVEAGAGLPGHQLHVKYDR